MTDVHLTAIRHMVRSVEFIALMISATWLGAKDHKVACLVTVGFITLMMYAGSQQ